MWKVETRKPEGTEWILFWVIGPVSEADLRDWHNAPAEPLLTLNQNVNKIQKRLLFPATSFISSAQFEAIVTVVVSNAKIIEVKKIQDRRKMFMRRYWVSKKKNMYFSEEPNAPG